MSWCVFVSNYPLSLLPTRGMSNKSSGSFALVFDLRQRERQPNMSFPKIQWLPQIRFRFQNRLICGNFLPTTWNSNVIGLFLSFSTSWTLCVREATFLNASFSIFSCHRCDLHWYGLCHWIHLLWCGFFVYFDHFVGFCRTATVGEDLTFPYEVTYNSVLGCRLLLRCLPPEWIIIYCSRFTYLQWMPRIFRWLFLEYRHHNEQ